MWCCSVDWNFVLLRISQAHLIIFSDFVLGSFVQYLRDRIACFLLLRVFTFFLRNFLLLLFLTFIVVNEQRAFYDAMGLIWSVYFNFLLICFQFAYPFFSEFQLFPQFQTICNRITFGNFNWFLFLNRWLFYEFLGILYHLSLLFLFGVLRLSFQ